MGNVNQADRDLFRQALKEAFIRKFDRELENCPFSADCSEEHVSKMEAIVENSARAEDRKKRRKWIVALLVAAALLLTACTVYAYRGEIREFVEKVYEEHIKVTYYDADQHLQTGNITEFYTLGYVPEGYVLESEYYLAGTSKVKWVNEQDQYIVLEQHILDGSNFSMDSEYGQTSVVMCGEIEVYCLIAKRACYTWNNGTYVYRIYSSVKLSDDELAHMISELKIDK